MEQRQSESPPLKRRFFSYSLRSLMLVVTVFAVGSFWLGVQIKRARDQRQAVEAVLGLGGTVYYDFHYYEDESDGETAIDSSREPSSPRWLRDWLGLDLFHHVRKVQAVKLLAIPQSSSGGIDTWGPVPQATEFSQRIDEYMVHLAALHDLETLDLSHSSITDASLVHLESLMNLKLLFLMQTDVTDESIERLQRALPNCKIIHSRRRPTAYQRALNELQSIDLSEAQVTNEGEKKLQQASPNYKTDQ